MVGGCSDLMKAHKNRTGKYTNAVDKLFISQLLMVQITNYKKHVLIYQYSHFFFSKQENVENNIGEKSDIETKFRGTRKLYKEFKDFLSSYLTLIDPVDRDSGRHVPIFRLL